MPEVAAAVIKEKRKRVEKATSGSKGREGAAVEELRAELSERARQERAKLIQTMHERENECDERIKSFEKLANVQLLRQGPGK